MHRTLLIFTVLFVILLPSSALATWGTECRDEAKHHCYATAKWAMSGKGEGKGEEEVEGLESYIDTESMDVGEWAKGAFVTNEQWAGFPYGGWVEDGQEAGDGEGGANCCTLRWFTAYVNKSGKYEANESPWEESGGKLNRYNLQSAISTGGAENKWCFAIGEGSAGCVEGVATYSTNVTVGMEAASNTEPTNSGKDETLVMHLNKKWYDWNTATLKEDQWDGEPSTHVCASGWKSIAGDIDFGTC
jgi:hypothetical protein